MRSSSRQEIAYFPSQQHPEANGSELNDDVDTVGPDSHILLNDGREGQAAQRALKKPRWTWKGGMINNHPEGFDDATIVRGHGVRSSAPMTIMIDLDTRYSNHEFMEIKHDRIPAASSTNKSTSGRDNLIILPQSAQVGSCISTVVDLLVLVPNITPVNHGLISMSLDFGDFNRALSSEGNHGVDNNQKVTIRDQ